MKIFYTTAEYKEWRFGVAEEKNLRSIGFVPTMGALHEGHASLMRKAREMCDLVVLSILVNPTQFGDASDLESYPRALDADLLLAKHEGVDVVITPTPEDLYGGTPSASEVDWGSITSDFEATFRPGHFDGVVAVVNKLFNLIKPQDAFFGEKDLQQVAVIRMLTKDLHPSIQIHSCDLVRDEDGLAMSSRNTRLSEPGRGVALELSRSLVAVSKSGDFAKEIAEQIDRINSHEGIELEYLAGVNEVTYSKSDDPSTWTHAIIAAKVDGVRLIDNIRL